ncbi:hypothetical protein COO60DRAFT_203539 [Scenedesmus sp. NREL 46B-D3]|nr:hypothetical protein COO60DRAFT_203539 [Scenedesmus sp. NREL 46B-D3]
MSTLERSKAYDVKLRPHQLGNRTNERINNRTPHQAPQRERVSLSSRPRDTSSRSSSPVRQRPNSRGNATAAKATTWQELISPDVNMGVPTLLMLLEPNVVWRHAAASNGHARHGRGRSAEAAACQGIFFDGHDQLAKLSHGVYEGSYWQLLGDLGEIEAMLSRMTRAPSLLDEPTLQLPPEPDLPKWEQFKPELVPLPEAPAAAAAPTLPPFVEPDLPASVPRAPVELLPVPPLPPAWKELVAPACEPPLPPKPEPLQLPELLLPPAPVLRDPARPPPANPPKHGHDWTGKRPFTVPAPCYAAPQLPPEPEEVLPEVEGPQLQEAQLQLQPEPLLVLGWRGGPEDSDAQHADTGAAGMSGCAAQQQQPQQQQQQQQQQAVGERDRAVGAAGGSGHGSGGVQHGLRPQQGQALALEQLHEAWQQVQAAPVAAAGTPHVWLDFRAPFADPPPVFVPNRPEPGPEPQLVLPPDLPQPPIYQPPVPQPMPPFVEPPMVLPSWAAPCEPLPVGFLRGSAPVLVMDVSGTMHPARRGQFRG